MAAHVQMECSTPDCGGSCNACCLAWCSVCGGGEAELTTDCPGVRTTEEQREAVSAGSIDFRDGAWRMPTDEDRYDYHPRFKGDS